MTDSLGGTPEMNTMILYLFGNISELSEMLWPMERLLDGCP
jgi:hypothetical protein